MQNSTALGCNYIIFLSLYILCLILTKFTDFCVSIHILLLLLLQPFYGPLDFVQDYLITTHRAITLHPSTFLWQTWRLKAIMLQLSHHLATSPHLWF